MTGTATVAGLLIEGWAIALVVVLRFSQDAPTSGSVGARNRRWGHTDGPAAPVDWLCFATTNHAPAAVAAFLLV
ncbi:MAG: hypothetical protein WA880_14605 [Ornithinimicrobium sp.]